MRHLKFGLSPRRLVAGLALVAISFTVTGCSYTSLFRATTTQSFDIEHMSATPISVESRNGSIEVHADAALSAVQITARISTGGNSQQEADERLEAVTIDIKRDVAGVLHIAPIFPEPRRSNDGVSFDIRMPEAGSVTAVTSNGRIKASGFTCMVDARSSNGSIEVIDHTGEAVLKSSNGSITARGQFDSLNAETSNGRVVASGVIQSLRAVSSNGRVNAEGVSGPVDVRTSNASITLSLTDDHSGPVKLQSSNGSIELTVGPAFGGELTLQTSNGSIRVEDPAGVVPYTNIERRSGTLRFSLPGETSTVRTSNASVRIKVRAD